MNKTAVEYVRACHASRVNQDWWNRHPLQRALQSLRASERAQVKRVYRELRKEMKCE